MLRRARLKLAAGQLDEALKLTSAINPADSVWRDAQFVTGDVLMRRQDYAGAVIIWEALFDAAPPSREQDAWFFAAQCCRELGRLADAEKYFRISLRNFPDRLAAHENLAFILSGSGRIWEAGRHFEVLLRAGSATYEHLALLGDLERPVEQRSLLETYARKAPDDPVVALGLAAHAFWEGDVQNARTRLSLFVPEFPENAAAQAMLGELLLDGDPHEFRQWYEALPPSVLKHPGILYVCGTFARRHNQLDISAACLQQAVQAAPTHRRACYQLSQVLHSLKNDAAGDMTTYAADLLKLSEAIDDVLRSDGQNADRMQNVVSLLEKTGRIWEACGWSLIALNRFPEETWPARILARYQDRLDDALPLVAAGANPATRLAADPTVEDDFRIFVSELETETAVQTVSALSSSIHFDDSGAVLDFEFSNGHDPATPGARMFEQGGGGAAVLDYDGDGWPDLYFPQGGDFAGSPPKFIAPANSSDTLLRNRNGTWETVTNVGLPNDTGFGQGPAVGDFNNDGFPDLYIGNIGRNQLLENMGDGTFRDVSEQLGGGSPAFWTASTAIADLNGDSCPELIDVNYLVGDGIYSAICNGKACSPSVFEAAPDHLHLNHGDGTFETVAGPRQSKGLGCVVMRAATDGKMNVFVANDQVANVLMSFTAGTDSNPLPFTETALQSGLAFNENGLSMGCMGIASDDISGNGLVDLFVTNFNKEPNTLYLQDAPGMFVDRTRTSGLFDAGYPYVGWGTQFIDADRDGLSDLVVTNGHVDDYRDEGGEFHMRPQFYRNTEGTVFTELSGAQIGDYFDHRFLGRGLAKLDWNRDGAMDFVVSNIRQAASLVTNRSTSPGHFLNVRLHGTASSRDAVGTQVTVTTENHTWTKQLTAGDGYMAANERVLQFGLGSDQVLKNIRIQWPSGESSLAADLPVDAEVVFVEGRPDACLLSVPSALQNNR